MSCAVPFYVRAAMRKCVSMPGRCVPVEGDTGASAMALDQIGKIDHLWLDNTRGVFGISARSQPGYRDQDTITLRHTEVSVLRHRVPGQLLPRFHVHAYADETVAHVIDLSRFDLDDMPHRDLYNSGDGNGFRVYDLVDLGEEGAYLGTWYK